MFAANVNFDLVMAANLLLAFVLGGVVGWLREREGKSAGLRTHILVCVGAAIFMAVAMEFLKISGNFDPGRIIAGVVTGIGFIGAGCIVQAAGSVRGITTAASIWITTAIGVAAGGGLYAIAVVATIITLITLELLGAVERKIIKSKEGH
jgi:putative Mg2+ transporter-C (MgtC) family protein